MSKKGITLSDILGRKDTAADFRALNPDLLQRVAAPSSEPARTPEPQIATKAPKEKKKSHGEALMEAYLNRQVQERKIKSFRFEAITLQVGENTCRYTPDFLVERFEGKPLLIEVKGKKKWEDSLIKWKAAKLQYTWIFDLEMWECSGSEWRQLYS